MTDSRMMDELQKGLTRARRLHQVYANGEAHALGVIRSEYLELEQAILGNESSERKRAEALDLAITALRFYMGEHCECPSEAHTGAIGIVDSFHYGKHGFGAENRHFGARS